MEHDETLHAHICIDSMHTIQNNSLYNVHTVMNTVQLNYPGEKKMNQIKTLHFGSHFIVSKHHNFGEYWF